MKVSRNTVLVFMLSLLVHSGAICLYQKGKARFEPYGPAEVIPGSIEDLDFQNGTVIPSQNISESEKIKVLSSQTVFPLLSAKESNDHNKNVRHNVIVVLEKIVGGNQFVKGTTPEGKELWGNYKAKGKYPITFTAYPLLDGNYSPDIIKKLTAWNKFLVEDVDAYIGYYAYKNKALLNTWKAYLQANRVLTGTLKTYHMARSGGQTTVKALELMTPGIKQLKKEYKILAAKEKELQKKSLMDKNKDNFLELLKGNVYEKQSVKAVLILLIRLFKKTVDMLDAGVKEMASTKAPEVAKSKAQKTLSKSKATVKGVVQKEEPLAPIIVLQPIAGETLKQQHEKAFSLDYATLKERLDTFKAELSKSSKTDRYSAENRANQVAVTDLYDSISEKWKSLYDQSSSVDRENYARYVRELDEVGLDEELSKYAMEVIRHDRIAQSDK